MSETPPENVPLKVTFRDLFGTFTPTAPCVYRNGSWWLQLRTRETPLDENGDPRAIKWRPA